MRKIQRTPGRIEDNIVIALIDDGVDMFDASLLKKVLEGKSFNYYYDKVRQVFLSATGHSTAIASMIWHVCLMAKIYPNYTAQDAIQAARDKKATIISMSWTLPGPKTRTNPEEDERVDVVKDCVANSGSGGTKNGGPNPVADFKYETGSSVVTALASSVATMIIYCVKASIFLIAKKANQNVTGLILGIGIHDDGAISVAKSKAMWQIGDELNKISHVLEQAQAQSWKAEVKQESIKRFVEFGQKPAKST
ncbi:hypothetical protein EDB81DRAFT_768756 [Dactylonectria macrodidyma]|uniref:Peptidase S8/S53 domain-containing protein n=1 Tax=Dactylonectria macrodidyma TaxID=307937 RepID=A0A9P9D1E7_9HYPO|nr:hypothetical protein EDB81DRAFT_768756 [Dactylonectria macrodidyma]